MPYKKPSAYKKKKTNATAISPATGTPDQYAKSESTSSELYSKFAKEIEAAQNYRGIWTQKQDTWHRLRMRIRKDKSFPFLGCSNLRMPTVDKYIAKKKAALMNLIWSQNPKTLVVPGMTGNPESAFKLEHYLDWLVDTKIKAFTKLLITADKQEEKGFSLIECIWKMESESRSFEIDLDQLPQELIQLIFVVGQDELLIKTIADLYEVDMAESVRSENMEAIMKAVADIRSGKKKVRVRIEDETYNNPDWNIIDPEQVYVPVDATIDIQALRWIAVEVYEPFSAIKQKAAEGIYDSEAVAEIDALKFANPESKSAPVMSMTQTQFTKDLREGITMINNPSQMVKLWRMYAWHDIDGDGRDERCTLILAPAFQKCLAKFPFPYAHRKWPIVRFDSEILDNRWYSSRGIPERIEDIAKEIDTQHNQKIDQQTIRNAPMFTFRSGVVNPKLVKFIPGQAIPVPGTIPLDDAVSIMRNESSNVEFSYRDEEMLLKAEINELLGSQDLSLQSLINRREPRTATEAGIAQQSANTIFSLDVMMFATNSLSDLFNQTLQLTQQYLPNEVYFTVTGDQQPIRLTRDEIQGEYLAKVRANDLSVNSTQRVSLAMARTQFLSQPIFTGTGIVGLDNIFNLGKRYLQDTGEFSWQGYLTPPNRIPPKGPPPPITQIKVDYKDLTDLEQAQVLESGGVKPDMPGRLLERQEQVLEKMGEEKSVEQSE